jgi:murein DD-endopeptidase
MSSRPGKILRTAFLITICVAAVHGRASGRPDIELKVPVPPTLVRVEGHWLMSYELHLLNRSDAALTLDELSLIDEPGGRPIAHLAGNELARDVAIVDANVVTGAELAPIAPRKRAIIFVDVDTTSAVESIDQRLSYRVEKTSAKEQVESAPLAMRRASPTLIAPPLRGGPWVAIHSPLWPRGHRRVFYNVDGKERLPARFAIDWIKVDDQGRFSAGDEDIVSSWYGYGADVLAVADAIVADVRDGMHEPARISQRTKHVPAEDAGNYVTLRLADGHYAFYEHLKQGSIRVAIGDKVRVGEVIGHLGFSGESTGPHLHFHIADSNSPLGAEGLPFEIRQFRRLGRYDDISRLGKPWNAMDVDQMRRDEWPAVNEVVAFDRDTAE